MCFYGTWSIRAPARVHIGGRTVVNQDFNSGDFEATMKAHAGLGTGLKFGFTITNVKQKFHEQVKD